MCPWINIVRWRAPPLRSVRIDRLIGKKVDVIKHDIALFLYFNSTCVALYLLKFIVLAEHTKHYCGSNTV